MTRLVLAVMVLALLTGCCPAAPATMAKAVGGRVPVVLELGTALYCTDDGLVCWESVE